ncbi:hypothetical protein SOHN41_02302 [Shewanella sp. HN-41]|nr:hypothetical protein SOHN41_02302 [Shewanella sp. HN-41]
MPPKIPFRSFMASMTLEQRHKFAEVANRADERRSIREQRLGLKRDVKKNIKKDISLWKILTRLLNRYFVA